jgi:hypothetical protein
MELIAVNSGDSKEQINKYVDEGKFTFRIGMDDAGGKNHGVAAKYGVMAYPTNYVLDSSGKVVWRAVGFDETGLRAALEKLGVK